MKLPARSTIRFQVLLALYKFGSMTRNETNRRCPEIESRSMRIAFKHGMENGELIRMGQMYSLSPEVADHFALTEEKPSEVPELVRPRVNNVYAAPALSAKYIPSIYGNRPGSNDHLNWNSPFGKKVA